MTQIPRRALLVGCAATILSGLAFAQAPFPSRPISMVVAQTPGAAADTMARLVAEGLARELGQPVVVENKTGGNTVVGTSSVARAPADGYTVLEFLSANLVVSLMHASVPYSIQKDFTPVIGIGSVGHVLAVPRISNIRSIADLVSASKARGGIAFGSGGAGSMSHMSGALLNQHLKLDATHVPFRGLAPSYPELLTNRIQFLFPSTVDAVSLAKGDVVLLAITSDERSPLLPDVPTMKELGMPQLDAKSSYGFLVPAKTPQAVVDRLADGIAKVISNPEVQKKLSTFGFTTKIEKGADYGKYIAAELARWQSVIEVNKLKVE